ncbi:MAG: hypothetical protein ACTSWU_00860 [Candidatus Thorarchaeota archaeon]
MNHDNTTQTETFVQPAQSNCDDCGTGLIEGDAFWVCPACGLCHDRVVIAKVPTVDLQQIGRLGSMELDEHKNKKKVRKEDFEHDMEILDID